MAAVEKETSVTVAATEPPADPAPAAPATPPVSGTPVAPAPPAPGPLDVPATSHDIVTAAPATSTAPPVLAKTVVAATSAMPATTAAPTIKAAASAIPATHVAPAAPTAPAARAIPAAPTAAAAPAVSATTAASVAPAAPAISATSVPSVVAAKAVPATPATSAPSLNTQTDLKEPQSALTAKFTQEEWAALKEFRTTLKDIFAEAYRDMPELQDTRSIEMWGVKIDADHPVDARVSVLLMKFLRSRHLNVYEARSMLVATLRWREHFGVAAALKEEFPKELFGRVGRLFGRDKAGRPVMYSVYDGHQDLHAVFGDVQRFLRWRVALMERCVALLDFETVSQTVQINDYNGAHLSSQDNNTKNAASEATSIFQSHYPELLYRKYFINVPTLLSWMYWIFKPLVSPAALERMQVVGSGRHEVHNALLAVIDADELPRKYGGVAEGF